MSNIKVYTNLSGGFFIGTETDCGFLEDLAMIILSPQTGKFTCVPANVLTEGNKFHKGYIGQVNPKDMNWVECKMIDKYITDQYIQLTTGITLATSGGGNSGKKSTLTLC